MFEKERERLKKFFDRILEQKNLMEESKGFERSNKEQISIIQDIGNERKFIKEQEESTPNLAMNLTNAQVRGRYWRWWR